MRIAILFLAMLLPASAQDISTFHPELPIANAKSGVTPPKLISNVEPQFDDDARRRNITGKVTIFVVIESDGRVGDVRLVRSLSKGLDREALDAVKKWRFEPAKKDHQPIATKATIDIDFRMFDSYGPLQEMEVVQSWETELCAAFARSPQLAGNISKAPNSPEAQMTKGCEVLSRPAAEVSHKQASEYFIRAAEGGLPHAELLLAGLYMAGLGVKRDMAQALKWSRVAEANGATVEQEDLDVLLSQMKPVDIEKGQAAADEWIAAWKMKHQ
jgi:TonB family protein